MFVRVWGFHRGAGYEVIDRWQSCRFRMSPAAALHRSKPERGELCGQWEHADVQKYENIEPVRQHLFADRLQSAGQVTKVIRFKAVLRRYVVLLLAQVIAERFESAAVSVAQPSQVHRSHRVML